MRDQGLCYVCVSKVQERIQKQNLPKLRLGQFAGNMSPFPFPLSLFPSVFTEPLQDCHNGTRRGNKYFFSVLNTQLYRFEMVCPNSIFPISPVIFCTQFCRIQGFSRIQVSCYNQNICTCYLPQGDLLVSDTELNVFDFLFLKQFLIITDRSNANVQPACHIAHGKL